MRGIDISYGEKIATADALAVRREVGQPQRGAVLHPEETLPGIGAGEREFVRAAVDGDVLARGEGDRSTGASRRRLEHDICAEADLRGLGGGAVGGINGGHQLGKGRHRALQPQADSIGGLVEVELVLVAVGVADAVAVYPRLGRKERELRHVGSGELAPGGGYYEVLRKKTFRTGAPGLRCRAPC
ncbi:MAG: hypothetical protein LUE99_08415 [Bacteroides sp.]|nr:hypothetical protein [Bacteroides sp.]